METYTIEIPRKQLQFLTETLVQVEGYFDDAFNLDDKYYFRINIPIEAKQLFEDRGFKLNEQIPEIIPYKREGSI